MKRMRKIHHSPEEKVRLQAIRDQFQTARPSLDELTASGEYSEPVRHGVTLDAMHIASLLKQARQEADLSLAAVAKRCGLDRGEWGQVLQYSSFQVPSARSARLKRRRRRRPPQGQRTAGPA